jgi:hypothetical protein
VANKGLQALEAQLGRSAPAGLRRLRQDQLQDLADAVRGARRRQAAELARAGDQAFAQIPWLLRKPIRKLMG